MGLERVNPDADPRAVDVPFALYDGSQFVLNQSDWTVLTMLRMGLRYGTAPLRFNGVPAVVYEKFKAIYDLQVITNLWFRSGPMNERFVADPVS